MNILYDSFSIIFWVFAGLCLFLLFRYLLIPYVIRIFNYLSVIFILKRVIKRGVDIETKEKLNEVIKGLLWRVKNETLFGIKMMNKN